MSMASRIDAGREDGRIVGTVLVWLLAALAVAYVAMIVIISIAT